MAGPIQSKTDGQRGPGGASRSLGGRDDPRSLSTSNRRWIPPSTYKRDAQSHENKNDIVFRKVRGILNKLTPEKFEKLSEDLLCIGLDSPTILKGVILLIFEKALDEPKYSSMYAQLCRRLSEEAPNFEPPATTNNSSAGNGSNNSAPPSISTFRQLLLAKCRVEFENRSAAQEVFETRDGSLTADEEEQRQAAKRKMLGNIKFIGELGKLGMLQGAILHMCIQQLLERKRRGGFREMAEDLECLCQIMRTCGRILDIDKAKSLMDQYFDRMAAYAVNQELPCRIRFMLQDSIDLRANHWQPRKIASTDGPRTIQQIREEAARDSGVYIPPPGSHLLGMQGRGQGGHGSPGSNGLGISPPSGLFPVSRSSLKGPMGIGLDDVFGSLPLGAVSIGTGPGVIPSMQDGYGYDSDSTHNNHGHNPNMYRGRQSYGGSSSSGGNGGGGGYSNRTSNGVGGNGGAGNNKQYTNGGSQMNNHQQQNSLNQANNAKNDLPPRFKKMMMTQQRSQGSTEEVSLRPPANSMLNKPKPTAAATLPKSAQGNLPNNSTVNNHAGPLAPLLDAALPLNSNTGSSLTTKIPITTAAPPILSNKEASDKQRSPRKDPGPTKEDVIKQTEALLNELLKHQSVEDCSKALKEVKLIERFWPSVLARLMSLVVDKSDADRELVSQLMASLKKEASITSVHFLDAYKEMVNQLPEVEKEVPRAKSFLASLSARAVTDGLTTLADLAQPLEGGHQYPLFLLTLQQLHKTLGNENKAALIKLFNESKVQLMNTLPELDRTKERLGEILDDRGLGFLFPLLRIQSDLWKQIQADPTPSQFYKWIKENLDQSCYTVPGFISALFTVILKYIAQEASGGKPIGESNGTASSTDNSSSAVSLASDKLTQEKEKELLERYRPVLQAFLHDHVSLQVTVLHSLQTFCYGLNFPKGMLLRWFVALYDLEILEEDAFLKWKEDLSDVAPGKGKALFQVNTWLTWLEAAEESSNSDSD